jgi:hypothetical protein
MPPSPPPLFNTLFNWPNGTLYGEVSQIGGTAPGTYVASASSNSATAYYAFSASYSQHWVSAPNYNSTTGQYIGSAITNTTAGEWVQLQFPEQFSPKTFTLQSDITQVALFGSNDGATWYEIDSPCSAFGGAG